MELIWHGYLVYSLGNYVIKLYIKIGLRVHISSGLIGLLVEFLTSPLSAKLA